MTARFIISVLLAMLIADRVLACAECGGGKAAWLALEAAPKASDLYPAAKVVEYTLDVAEEWLAPAGKNARALTLNGSLPGPTLRFRVGEIARIHVRNRLAKEETSIHWHGLLVPNLEDGVPVITTPPIAAGESRTFEFLLKHAGTYWYHSHTGLQEQRGVYGSIVIDPPAGTAARPDLPHIDREEVLVLSDWTNERADEVMRTLLRGSDWYAIRKGTAQSLLGAMKAGRLSEYLAREKSRVPAMDVSDVGYDAFLINGRPVARRAAQPGETVRLRVINAAASTYFYLSSAAGPFTIVAADGMGVAPIRQRRLLIGMAETYDVLMKIPESEGSWEVRATAQDDSGHASLFLGRGADRFAPAPGPLDPYSMEDAMAAVLDELDRAGDISDEEALAAESDRPLPPYKRLRSTTSTTLPAAAPRREVTLKLTGDMARYLWSIDGRTIDEQSTIAVKRGEVLKLILVNNTMMHHPMHLHGHFFRLLMPDGADPAFAPLKHTVDVPPMSRRVIEFYANEDRDWLFHCHLLFHMMTGMARVASYPAGSEMVDTAKADAPAGAGEKSSYTPRLGEHGHPHMYAWIEGDVQTHMSSGVGTIQRGRDNVNVAWELGWQRVDRREYEINATYSHYFGPRWTVFGGYRLTNVPGGHDALVAGAVHQLPYFVEATATIQSNGDARLALAKALQLTARMKLVAGIEYDTAQDFSWSMSVACKLAKRVSIIAGYDDDYGAGGGLQFRF